MKKDKIGVKEAAQILGLSKKSVYTKLRSGQLKGEKINTKYGQKWIIEKEQLEDQAKIKNEVIEAKEINELVSKEELLNELSEALNSHNKALINEAVQTITKKLDKQEQAILAFKNELKEIKEKQEQSFIDKIKNIFR